MAALTREEENIAKRVMDLRREAASASNIVGSAELFQLSQEIESLMTRQQALAMERDDHERIIK